LDAIIKASLYIGTILFLGAGVFGYFVNNTFLSNTQLEQGIYHRLLVGILLGAGLVIFGTIFNLIQTVTHVLGTFDAAFTWEYATSTRHGLMSFIRLGLIIILVPLVLQRKGWTRVLFSIAAIGFLATFSIISHSGSMGTLPLIADLLHLIAASLWTGAVLYSVIGLNWSQDITLEIQRVSSLGLLSVLLLLSTGIYTSVVHIRTLNILLTSPYGRVLIIKVVIVLIILIIAAVNRIYFVPKLLKKKESFRQILMGEALLLLMVLATTGLLSVSALPHD
jgi:putative copper export protein